MFYYFNQAIRNYVNFKSRTSRKAYWLTILTFLIINFILYIPLMVTGTLGHPHAPHGAFITVWLILLDIYGLFLILPSLSLMVRRFHDTNKSAWNLLFLLIPIAGVIVVLVFCLLAGDAGANKYGEPARDCK